MAGVGFDWAAFGESVGGVAGALGLIGGGIGFFRSRSAEKTATKARKKAGRALKESAEAATRSSKALDEANRLTIARIPERSQTAYENLLMTVGKMLSLDFKSDLSEQVAELRMRMLFFSELVDSDFPEIAQWLDAERQLSLYRLQEVNENLNALAEDSTIDQMVLARDPWGRWVAEFITNLRWWRTGRMTPDQVIRQTEQIRDGLKKLGRWQTELSWRTDLPRDENGHILPVDEKTN